MFCKSITSSGCPCVSRCESGKNYCRSHNNNHTECEICMEKVSCNAILPCQHSICMSCVHKCCDINATFKCPFCRNLSSINNLKFHYNNNKIINTKTKRNIIEDIMSMMKCFINDDGNYHQKDVKRIMDKVFKNHLILFAYNRAFLALVMKSKLKELSKHMDVKRYQKQLQSYENRMSI